MDRQETNQNNSARLRKVQMASLTRRSGLDADTQELLCRAADKVFSLDGSDLYKFDKLLRTLVSLASARLKAQEADPPESGFIIQEDELPDSIGEIDSIPVESLSLSVRAYHCLTRNNLLTAGDVRRTLEDGSIKKIRNLGAMTEKEISNTIEKIYGEDVAERWKKW